MPFGILEDRKLEHVPGTAPLNELGSDDHNISGIDSSILKHDPTGKIVLVPQPSDSPNDPYNWPRRKKELFTIAFAYGCGAVGAVGPLLGAAFVPIAKEWDVSLTSFISGAQGGLIIAIAVGSIIFNSLAVKYGKRPIYLATCVGLVVSSFWAAEAKSFESFVAARVVQGFSMAPMEALIPASIADIWFIHERGFRTAIFNLGVLGGINLATPIAGIIIEISNWRVAMRAMGGAFVLQLIVTFFFMPETSYHRTGVLNIDTGKTMIETEKGVVASHEEDPSDEKSATVVPTVTVVSAASEPKMSWAQEMRPYSGYVNQIPLLATMLRPFYLLASPMVLWAALCLTTALSWLVMISICISQIFSAPPYNFAVRSVGATNLSSFVASVIGTLIAGPTIDGIAKRVSKKNKGVFEPEFRLPIMIAYCLLTGTGFFGWGQAAYAQDPWPVPVIVCMGMINLGVQLGVTGIFTYVVDCHREQAGEAFAALNFIKSIFIFGLTFYVNNWIATQGIRNAFFVMGGITIFCSLTTIPMYIYGKRSRSWVARHNIAKRSL